MYQKEQHVFCIQGHIEMTKAYAAQLYQLRKHLFTPTLFQQAINSFDASHDYQLVTKWITDFIWPQ